MSASDIVWIAIICVIALNIFILTKRSLNE
jgi:hypothetical protein